MIFLGLYAPVSAEVLKGGVSYTVGTARKIAFENISQTIDMAKYANGHIYDPNKKANINALKKNKTNFINRTVNDCGYLDEKRGLAMYSVEYKNNPNIEYFYILPEGMLVGINIIKHENDFPVVMARYFLDGSLVDVILLVDYDNHFFFNKNKKLISHCVGDNCYNEKGKLIKKRK